LVKTKTARRIDATQFEQAVGMLAEKLFDGKSKNEQMNLILDLIKKSGGTPKLEKNTTTASTDNVTQRLTDHTGYTGKKSLIDRDTQK
jgi:hypothetical protein